MREQISVVLSHPVWGNLHSSPWKVTGTLTLLVFQRNRWEDPRDDVSRPPAAFLLVLKYKSVHFPPLKSNRCNRFIGIENL